MSTGDLAGNIQRLVDHLHAIAYPSKVSYRRLQQGDPAVLLPMLHYVLCDYSPHVTSALQAKGYRFYALDDRAFCDAVFHVAVDWKRRPQHSASLLSSPGLASPLRPSSVPAPLFLQPGFAERKILFVVDMIQAAVAMHEEASRVDAVKHFGKVPPYSRTHDISSPVSQSHRIAGSEPYTRPHLVPASDPASVLPNAAHPYTGRAATASNMIRSFGVLTAATHTSKHETEEDTVWRFLSDAVAIGTGASTSLAARKSQVLLDSKVTLPNLAQALDTLAVNDAVERAQTTHAPLRSSANLAPQLSTDIMRMSTEFLRNFPTRLDANLFIPVPTPLPQHTILTAPTQGARQSSRSEASAPVLASNVPSGDVRSPLSPSRLPVHVKYAASPDQPSSPARPPRQRGTVLHGRAQQRVEAELEGQSTLVEEEHKDSQHEYYAGEEEEEEEEQEEGGQGSGSNAAAALAFDFTSATHNMLATFAEIKARLRSLEEREQKLAEEQDVMMAASPVPSAVVAATVNASEFRKNATETARRAVRQAFQQAGVHSPPTRQGAPEASSVPRDIFETPSTASQVSAADSETDDVDYQLAMRRMQERRAIARGEPSTQATTQPMPKRQQEAEGAAPAPVPQLHASSQPRSTFSMPSSSFAASTFPAASMLSSMRDSSSMSIAAFLESMASRGAHTDALVARAKTQLSQ